MEQKSLKLRVFDKLNNLMAYDNLDKYLQLLGSALVLKDANDLFMIGSDKEDNSGELIFQGDIVQEVISKSRFLVCFHEGKLKLRYIFPRANRKLVDRVIFRDWLNEKEFKILGNELENPELLEPKAVKEKVAKKKATKEELKQTEQKINA